MDMYLRSLKAIDAEVVDRDVIRSQQVNFVNCFKNCNAIISIGENISPTERGTIKQKLITYSILYNSVLPNISYEQLATTEEPILVGVGKVGLDMYLNFLFA